MLARSSTTLGSTEDNSDPTRKIREWTTLDLIVNYTFNLPLSVAQNEVAGYARDGGKNADMKDGKERTSYRSLPRSIIHVAGAHGSITPPSRLA